MPDLSPKQLKNDARLALTGGSSDHKRIISIYAAIMLGASFLVSLTYFIVDLLIQNTAGGLAGLGITGTLKGITSFVELIVSILTPFLTMSLMHCAIGFARQDHMEAKSLKEGFYRWGVFLRLMICQILMYVLVSYLAVLLASFICVMLPGMDRALLQVEPIVVQAQTTGTVSTAQALFLLQHMWPMLAVCAVLVMVVIVYLSYSYRMSFYRIMDNDPPRARRAIAQSLAMMKKRKWKLFRLDLSFWWYYLLQGALNFVMILATLLLGGLFPGADLLCQAALCVAMFFVYRKYLAYVETTYAVFYDKVLQLYLPRPWPAEPTQYQAPIAPLPLPEETDSTNE